MDIVRKGGRQVRHGTLLCAAQQAARSHAEGCDDRLSIGGGALAAVDPDAANRTGLLAHRNSHDPGNRMLVSRLGNSPHEDDSICGPPGRSRAHRAPGYHLSPLRVIHQDPCGALPTEKV